MKTELNWLDPSEHEPDDDKTYIVALTNGAVEHADRVDGDWFEPGSDVLLRGFPERYAEWPKHPRWDELNKPVEATI